MKKSTAGTEGSGHGARVAADGPARVGPVVAARTLDDAGDLARFADRNRFASC